ncbi:tRNA (adenosine(37)-N6)-threonylcarbamoyltransferase complex ATPase subunit type 1 TsaE [Thermodesulfatator atlanticus]|uniref:tRNA (adenosine(37)-N6)-threonylcarbamoyltransferase complex ATPase subunit type 1 TsaE n=1 Tax=Thermodesulfatator atlanticus TaxID=501497 RepID=UPI0003B3BAD3|nr:tRNA (adenosine(37)-N6)-threonylcarbamoyltransferase complex ATPase subunit type 1 TsaE [Thermodesulfatator atlanticus]
MEKIKSQSPEETQKIAENFGKTLEPGTVILLFGDLGAGKTTFVKGLARALGVPQDYYVQSPTFAIINEYPGRVPVFHVDLYRLEPEDVFDLGLEELADQGILVIEWSEKLPFSFDKEIKVHLKILGPEEREITIEKN